MNYLLVMMETLMKQKVRLNQPELSQRRKILGSTGYFFLLWQYLCPLCIPPGTHWLLSIAFQYLSPGVFVAFSYYSESSLLIVPFPLETFLLFFFCNHRVKLSLNGDFFYIGDFYITLVKLQRFGSKRFVEEIFNKE